LQLGGKEVTGRTGGSATAIFSALADPTRRRILEILKSTPGLTTQELTAHFSVSRFAVMKHLNILESAGLIRRDREGVSKFLYFESAPLIDIRDGWLRDLTKK
jgi:DNA-binding transcriptional ArsR family regulator